MRIFHSVLLCFTILVTSNASLINLKEGWTLVPTRSGVPMPVNIASALSQPQLLFNVENDVVFELYTLKNKKDPQILSSRNISTITSSNFDKTKPTRIYIHGWQEHASMMKTYFNDAYLEKAKKDVNLIAVNWAKSSHTLNYIAAANRVESIGSYVATFIDFLVNNKLASLEDMTLIGFSLGAHVAGIAGKQIQTGKLPKIVGLDPAGPLFPLDKPSQRLDKNDAKYVEIIHTSGTWLGIHKPIGTVSFYPNHGKSQSGCRLDFTGVCSHMRAFKYFAESIYAPVTFWGYPCDSYEDMKKSNCKGVGTRMGGEPGNYRNEASIYYLETNEKSFFARGGSRDM